MSEVPLYVWSKPFGEPGLSFAPTSGLDGYAFFLRRQTCAAHPACQLENSRATRAKDVFCTWLFVGSPGLDVFNEEPRLSEAEVGRSQATRGSRDI